MNLEEILETTAKTIIWPFKTIDSVLKFGHDAIAAGAGKLGLDRYSLAKYCAISGTAAFGVLTATNLAFGNYFGMYILGGYTAVFSILIPKASEMRNYFSLYKDTLYRPMERTLILTRSIRMVPLGFAIAGAATGEAQGTLGVITGTLFFGGLATISSAMYLMDGDHSNWDKTKAKVKSAYHSLSSLMPKRAAQPQPGRAISYN